MKLSVNYLNKHWIIPLLISGVCFIPTSGFAEFLTEDQIFTPYEAPSLESLPVSKVEVRQAQQSPEPDVDPKLVHALSVAPIQVTKDIVSEGRELTWSGNVVSENPNFLDRNSQEYACHTVARNQAGALGATAAVTSSTSGQGDLVTCDIRVRVDQ